MVLPKLHIHLGVGDAARSAAFYEALLGARPACSDATTAVFELDSPPLVLTVEHTAPSSTASQFALLVDEPRLIGDVAIALRRAGVRLRLEDEGIEAHDPDGNAWRVRFVPSRKGRAVLAT